MKSKILWALAAANVLLLVTFVARVTHEHAVAQVPRPSDYLVAPGRIMGGTDSVVYILDLNNRQLGAIALDEPRGEIGMMDPLDLDRVFEEAMFGE